MSEQLPASPEQTVETPIVTTERPKAAEYSNAEKAEHIHEAQAAVAAESSTSEQPVVPQDPKPDHGVHLIDKAGKRLRLHKNLTQVQNRLKPTEKAFSKVIHQPLVSRVSDSAAKNVTRPSGLLGGGIVAFIGSLTYLYLARHVGFTYNYLFFLIFFIGGFALGVLAEYGAYWLRRSGAR